MRLLKILFVLFISINIDISNADNTIIFSNYNFANTIYMDRLSIQRIFTKKETRWSNGDNIIVFIKPMDSIEHKMFVSNILNMTLYKYQKILDESIYTAKSLPLTEVNNDIQMSTNIQNHPGAIGYINYNLLYGTKTIIICDENCPKSK